MRAVLIALVCLVGFASCWESDSARNIRVAKEKVKRADTTRDKYIAGHPDLLRFRDDDGGSLSGNFTLQIQDRISAQPNQLYWTDHDDFDVYRATGGVLLIIKSEGTDWLYIRCTDKQAQQILGIKKGNNFPRFLFVFSLSAVAPLRVELASEGDSEARYVTATGINGHIYEGTLVDLLLLDNGS
jgi:hypothetical protein